MDRDEILIDELNSVSGMDSLSEENITKALMIGDAFKRQQAIISLEAEAKSVGQSRNFQKLVKIVGTKLSTPNPNQTQSTSFVSNVTGFDLQLTTGEWICDNQGVRRYVQTKGQLTEEVASWQPVIISNIYYNQEFNTCRVQLMFKESENAPVKTITVNKSIIANTSNITMLSDFGISITSANAPMLVKYLNDLEKYNVDVIPRSNAISRLGWIGKDFVPYNSSIHFDGETMYKDMFDAIKCNGDYEEWKQMVKEETSVQSQMVLGASFASPLVGLLGSLTFFTHLWGNSGTGKSVALYYANSVWGNPEKLVQNLNGTAVALERFAGFFCNLPLCLDELQTLRKANIKDISYDDILYKLGQGRGKPRGRKDGTIDRVQTWAMSIITSGEEPIVSDNSGGGAKNRVIEVYCRDGLFTSALRVIRICKEHYGWAGKDFITKLTAFIEENTIKPIQELYDTYLEYALSIGTTEKQAMAATMIALGYVFMEMFIFDKDEFTAVECGKGLLDKMKPMLFKLTDINNVEDFYDDVLGFVEQNKHHFLFKNRNGVEYNPIDQRLEVWGKIDDKHCFIANNVFELYCKNNGLSYRKVLQSLSDSGCIECKDNGTRINATKPVRVGTTMMRCIAVRKKRDLFSQIVEEVDDDETMPF